MTGAMFRFYASRGLLLMSLSTVKCILPVRDRLKPARVLHPAMVMHSANSASAEAPAIREGDITLQGTALSLATVGIDTNGSVHPCFSTSPGILGTLAYQSLVRDVKVLRPLGHSLGNDRRDRQVLVRRMLEGVWCCV